MGFQCAVQVMALQRGDPQPHPCKHNPKHITKPQHVANGLRMLKEMMEERASLTQNLDRSLSDNNVYLCAYNDLDSMKGEDIWNAMVDEAENTDQVAHGKNGKVYTRSIRKDCIIGVATILHAPSEVVDGWDKETFEKFNADAYDVLAEIDCDIFKKENWVCTAEHYDEAGAHVHQVHKPKNEKGNYVGSRVRTRKWLQNLNEQFPKRMRERGWDVDDVDETDFKKMKYDKDYQVERRVKFRKSGRSVNELAKDETDELLESISEMQKNTEEILYAEQMVLAALQAQEIPLAEIEKEKAKLQKSMDDWNANNEERAKILDEINSWNAGEEDRNKVLMEIEKWKAEDEAKRTELLELADEVSKKESEIDKLDEEILTKKKFSDTLDDVSAVAEKNKKHGRDASGLDEVMPH